MQNPQATPIQMKEQLEQIRRLLDELENSVPKVITAQNSTDFSAFELPRVIQEIVDDLQPLLTPYQAAFYWYMFRHSIAENGSPLVRVSTRELQTDAVKSQSTRSEAKISITYIREKLAALEALGVIRKQGEPDNSGTPYRIFIPDEIESCRKFRAERLGRSAKPELLEKDLDFYNVRENRVKVFERDGYKCRYCGKQLTRFTATLDHTKPVCEGGENSFENLLTACLNCNSRKNRKAMGDFLADQPT